MPDYKAFVEEAMVQRAAQIKEENKSTEDEDVMARFHAQAQLFRGLAN